RFRACVSQIDQVGMLVMVDQGIERQSHAGQPMQTGTEVGTRVMPGTGTVVIVADHGILMPPGRVAYPTEATLTRLQECRQNRLNTVAERQVGVADDAGSHARLAGMVRVGLGCQAGHKLDLADGSKLDRSTRAVTLTAFDEYGRLDVVAGRGVGKELVE